MPLGFEGISEVAIAEREIFDASFVRPFCLEVGAACLFDLDTASDCGLDLDIEAGLYFDPQSTAFTGGGP